MKSLAIFAALVMAGTLLSQPVHAQVVNGNFETSVPSNGTGGGWTTSHINGDGGWRSYVGDPNGGFLINEAGALASDPTISQLVSGLTVGATYNVTGEFKAYYTVGNSGSTQVFGAAVDGAFIYQSPALSESSWHSFSGSFVASSSSALLEISAERNGTDYDFAVDNIAMTFVSGPAAPPDTPEPGALAFVFAGSLAGAAILRRRYRTRL